MSDSKDKVLDLVAQANACIPRKSLAPLPPKDFPDVPEWHPHEHEVWRLGEEIRQLLKAKPALRKDAELQDAYLSVLENRKAGRGRQSFFSLLEFKTCRSSAPRIAAQLDDPDVVGHAISALWKMGSGDYVEEIRAFTGHTTTWIRNKAKGYVKKFEQRR